MDWLYFCKSKKRVTFEIQEGIPTPRNPRYRKIKRKSNTRRPRPDLTIYTVNDENVEDFKSMLYKELEWMFPLLA